MPADVVIYTTGYCAYCYRAKVLLSKKNVRFTEIDVSDRSDLRTWLVETSGQRTVPQIFVNGQSIGGFDELAGLERAGKLDAMLAAPPDADAPSLRH